MKRVHRRAGTDAVSAVSFDADGTLLGTFTGAQKGFETFFLEAAKSKGREFTHDTLAPILRRVKMEELRRRAEGFKPYVNYANARTHWLWFYEEVFRGMDVPEARDTALEFMERYESGEFTGLYADALPCLRALHEKGIPLILISNFSPLLLSFLEKCGISEFFRTVLISGVEGIEKPDAALFMRGAASLSLAPEKVLHVGNDPHEDYRGAKEAGFQALLLDREDIFAGESAERVRSLMEIPSRFF